MHSPLSSHITITHSQVPRTLVYGSYVRESVSPEHYKTVFREHRIITCNNDTCGPMEFNFATVLTSSYSVHPHIFIDFCFSFMSLLVLWDSQKRWLGVFFFPFICCSDVFRCPYLVGFYSNDWRVSIQCIVPTQLL